MVFGPTFRDSLKTATKIHCQEQKFTLIQNRFINIRSDLSWLEITLWTPPRTSGPPPDIQTPAKYTLLCSFRKRHQQLSPLTCSSFSPHTCPVHSTFYNLSTRPSLPVSTTVALTQLLIFIITASSPLSRPPCCQSRLRRNGNMITGRPCLKPSMVGHKLWNNSNAISVPSVIYK